LDGVIEHDDGFAFGAWTAPYRTPSGLASLLEAYGARFDLLLGRHTYDIWSEYWPKAPSSPMADRLNAATKYIATHRPESLSWGPVKALDADFVESIRKIKSSGDPDLIVAGSSTLTSTLIQQGLADELVLLVYPVWLGRGKRLFSDGTYAQKFTLVSTTATPTGVLLNTYRRAGSLRS
jgi:dihydrofolate reductase